MKTTKRGIIETSIELDGKNQPICCELASPEEVLAVANWKTARPPTAAMLDAIEYAALTCKRWNFYLTEGRSVTEINQLRDPVTIENEELAFLIIARANRKGSSILGLCLFRRTWSDNLVVDFLALHPDCLTGGATPAKGLGATLVYTVTEIAEALHCKAVWGEATRGSAPNYQRMFADPSITDHFYIQREDYQLFRESFARRRAIRSLLGSPRKVFSQP